MPTEQEQRELQDQLERAWKQLQHAVTQYSDATGDQVLVGSRGQSIDPTDARLVITVTL